MLQITVSRRHLTVFVAVIALVVSVAWVGAASRVSAGSSTPVVYVATGENFPDALGAGPAAAIVKGPILLVSQNSIPGETAAELTRLSPDKIIIVGGTAVVSPSVESGLAAYAGTVERIAGSNRYDTAARLSAATFPITASGGGGDADTLDGKDSTAFAVSGHDHDADYLAVAGKAVDADKLDGKDSTEFLTTDSYDTDTDGVVDSAVVKIRHADDGFYVDVAGGPPVCVTEPMTFDAFTALVAVGSLSLQPLVASTLPISGDVVFSPEGDPVWYVVPGAAIEDAPSAGTGAAAVPVNAVYARDAGTYQFAIDVQGENVQPAQVDYYGTCELAVIAYAGLGSSIDLDSTLW